MSQMVTLGKKQVQVTLSQRAERELAARGTPLVAEMELYFSCLIRKAVRFKPLSAETTATPVSGNLYIRFRPVGSRSCGAKVSDGKPPLDDFPIVNPTAYTPDWLKVDYRGGEWRGEFGYGASS
jgi:hypothetical protein